MLAHLVGLFNCLCSSGWAADGIVDVIPGDFCASTILAAAVGAVTALESLLCICRDRICKQQNNLQ